MDKQTHKELEMSDWKKIMEQRSENATKFDELVEEYVQLVSADRGYAAVTGGLQAMLGMLMYRLDPEMQESEIEFLQKDLERIRECA